LEIFCRSRLKYCLPKNSEFLPLWSEEDPSVRTLMTLDLPSESHFPDAGSARLSIGFMQTVIEFLSRPGDVVQDWSVGDGSSFYAGDFCGRHVIGMEERAIFKSSPEDAFQVVCEIDRAPPKVILGEDQESEKEDGEDGDDDDEKLFGFMNERQAEDEESSDE
jgi:hypothetical protein